MADPQDCTAEGEEVWAVLHLPGNRESTGIWQRAWKESGIKHKIKVSALQELFVTASACSPSVHTRRLRL